MSNFAFLSKPFAPIQVDAVRAEGHIHSDPRSACCYLRRALEAVVHWLYLHDRDLRAPYDSKLGALLHEPTFQNLLPQEVYQKAKLIQQAGNQAVHSNREVVVEDALALVRSCTISASG